MSDVVKIKRFPIQKTGYSTRATQSATQYGVGAMVDFPDQTLMTAAPEFWVAGEIKRINDERLQKSLGVDYFGIPSGKNNNGIAYVRFPEWYFCPVCRVFKPLRKWVEDYQRIATDRQLDKDKYMLKRPKCYKDGCDLVASGIVTICKAGHINDFPWIEWAHIKSKPSKEVCDKPLLTFRTGTSAAEGMQGLVVRCENCTAQATLGDAFYPDVFSELLERGRSEFKCQGKHPWRGTRCNCSEIMYTKQRGDTSVYFPISVSSIVIPSETEASVNAIKSSHEYKKIALILEDCEDITERKSTIAKKIDKWTKNISEEVLIKEKNAKKILLSLLSDDNDEEQETIAVDSIEYKYEEFCALSGITDKEIEGSEDFLREEQNISEYKLKGISKVVLVKKLREVRALLGFSRVKPVGTNLDSENFVNIKEENTNWYPGYEVRGEGIFIQFDLNQLEEWSKTDFAIKRREMMIENFSESFMAQRMNEKPDAPSVLLHTISHLLLKELSFECGYNVASLRERLYYRPAMDDDGMAAILIYTASGDSEGTLGGLVRQGRSDVLPRIFKTAIEKGKICSNDPVCIMSKGQGREGLNLAACHACGLLPETSCEKYNALLDRALVVGTFENPLAGYYSSWEDEIKENSEINEDEISVKQNTMAEVKVCDDGQKQTGNYVEIWDYIEDDTDDEIEITLFERLKEISNSEYEKPIYSGSILVDEKKVSVDLIWEKSKTLFFLSDNDAEYLKARDCGWNVFCEGHKHVIAEELLKCIEVK